MHVPSHADPALELLRVQAGDQRSQLVRVLQQLFDPPRRRAGLLLPDDHFDHNGHLCYAGASLRIIPGTAMVDVVRVRNRRGELVDAPAFSATDAKHNFGQLLDAAVRTGPVAITKQSKPTAVLISIDEYRALTQAEDRALDALSEEFDRRFAAMQEPGAAAAMQRAFDTPPEKLAAFASGSLRARSGKTPTAPVTPKTASVVKARRGPKAMAAKRTGTSSRR